MSVLISLTFKVMAFLQFSNALKWEPQEFVHEECATVHPDQSVNMTWDHWYLHLFSKPAMYEALHFLVPSEEFASLTDEQVQKSCFFMTQLVSEPKTVTGYGLNRTFFEMQISFPKYRKGVIDWVVTEPVVQYISTAYVILTDNKSYFLAIVIYEDGSKGFYVASPLAVIPPDDTEKIMQYLETHRFPKESIYYLHTDCEDDEYLNNIKKKLNIA